jgi:hypothetical protein
VADWAVEVLNDAVEADLLSLPKDMQARFLRISELLRVRASACWAAARETPGREAVGDAFDRKRWNRSGDLHSGGGTAFGRTSRVCEKTQKTPRRAIDLALKRLKEIGS